MKTSRKAPVATGCICSGILVLAVLVTAWLFMRPPCEVRRVIRAAESGQIHLGADVTTLLAVAKPHAERYSLSSSGVRYILSAYSDECGSVLVYTIDGVIVGITAAESAPSRVSSVWSSSECQDICEMLRVISDGHQ